jgi:hypothetical protein
MKEFLPLLFFVTKIKVSVTKIREGWMGSWKEDSLPFKGGSKSWEVKQKTMALI